MKNSELHSKIHVYTVVLKSLSPVTFFCNFGFYFIYILFFSIQFFFHHSPNSTCAKMQHALYYQLVFRMSTFFFQHCFSYARHGVYKFSDHFCFYIFPAIRNYILQVIQICRIMFYFLFLQMLPKMLDGIYIRRLRRETHNPKTPFWFFLSKQFFAQMRSGFWVVILWLGTPYHLVLSYVDVTTST